MDEDRLYILLFLLFHDVLNVMLAWIVKLLLGEVLLNGLLLQTKGLGGQ